MPESLIIDVGVAKTEKYASRESGDTVELVERPSGGFTVVMIDGQGSGRAAKTLSLLLSSKAVALVKEGVRDGVVARATHDYLFAFRHGQVSATLDLLSIDNSRMGEDELRSFLSSISKFLVQYGHHDYPRDRMAVEAPHERAVQ